MMNLYDLLLEYARQNNALYVGLAADRREALEHLDKNHWYGLISSKSRKKFTQDKIMVPPDTATALLEKIQLWLTAYKKSIEERFLILVNYGMGIYPLSVKAYKNFIISNHYESSDNSWILLDYLLSELQKELIKLSQQELEELLEDMYTCLPLATIQLFTDFLNTIQSQSQKAGWRYKVRTRKTKMETGAYTLQSFSRMAYFIFNEDHWMAENMIEKACSSERLANLWLFLSIHFISALRATDIVRIPKPELPYSGAEVRNRIRLGQDENLLNVIYDLRIRLRYNPRKPHKTEHYQNIPDLKLFIPTSLEKPLSKIIAIAASFHDDIQNGQPFIKASSRLSDIRSLFGEGFVKALDGNNFSTRRANKSYLQGLEMMSDQLDSVVPKGYMIAALARSHKSHFGELPDMTSIYLKDANFSGYSPEFIAREMFERGVFGFIPHVLLQIMGGKEYEKLPVSTQTQIIQQLALPPAVVDQIVTVLQGNLVRARQSVNELAVSDENVLEILQKIACGMAVGKSKESLCLATACGMGCVFPENQECFGCRYEIYTKAIFHQVVKEFVRFRALLPIDSDGRYRLILQKSIMPVISEFIMTVQNMYPKADADELLAIMEGGMHGYDYSIREYSS